MSPPSRTAPPVRRTAPASRLSTIYLRQRPDGWSVSRDALLLHLLDDEQQAFERALEVSRSDQDAPLPILILSGPGWRQAPTALD